MIKKKSSFKPVSYETIRNNKELTEFIEPEEKEHTDFKKKKKRTR